MKNIKIIIILFLLFGFATVYSQQSRTSNKEATKSNAEAVDPKLSPEEQAQILDAGKDNPAKIDESLLTDPKIDQATLATEDDFGPSNANPEQVKDEGLNDERQTKKVSAATKSQTTASQPAGDKAGNVINYRDMNGPGDQPEGEKPEKVTNYRELKGGNQQPVPPQTKDPNK